MACSLGAMATLTVHGSRMPSGLSFKDAQVMGRRPAAVVSAGRMSSLVLPSRSSSIRGALPVGSAVQRILGSDSADNNSGQRAPLVYNPLGLSFRGAVDAFGMMKRRNRRGGAPIFASASEDAIPEPVVNAADKVREVAPEEATGLFSKKSLLTGTFFLAWYFLNVIFNILNKKLYNYFPFPYFVSVVHLFVGVVYCLISWGVGVPKRAPIDKELLLLLLPVAVCHALGHIMSNVSFAAVAVSFTHTIKALEPFFNAAASQFILGEQIPVKLWLSLAPIVLGVSAASLTELSFNWTGFLSAMVANVAFTYRNIYSKKAMTGMDSTNVYAYISILSLALCIPPAIIVEGPALLKYGFSNAIDKVGLQKFLYDLFWVGMFYHLYNQLANNTLERVAPLTHAVGNVLKRVFVIGFTIVVFGNKISTQTGIGTVVAIAGVGVYSVIKADLEEKKRALKKAESV